MHVGYERRELLCDAGIGLATALKYLEDEDDVVLVGRSMERLEKAIPKDFQGKGKAFLVAQDVSTVKKCPGETHTYLTSRNDQLIIARFS